MIGLDYHNRHLSTQIQLHHRNVRRKPSITQAAARRQEEVQRIHHQPVQTDTTEGVELLVGESNTRDKLGFGENVVELKMLERINADESVKEETYEQLFNDIEHTQKRVSEFVEEKQIEDQPDLFQTVLSVLIGNQ